MLAGLGQAGPVPRHAAEQAAVEARPHLTSIGEHPEHTGVDTENAPDPTVGTSDPFGRHAPVHGAAISPMYVGTRGRSSKYQLPTRDASVPEGPVVVRVVVSVVPVLVAGSSSGPVLRHGSTESSRP